MHYYTYSALVFFEGKIRDAYNLIYKSEKPSTIIEFRRNVAANYAGPPDTYGAIMIPTWQEIDEATYLHIQEGFNQI